MQTKSWLIFALLLCSYGNLLAHYPEDGTGTVSLPDGSVYEGELAAGRFSGSGILTYPNGDVFAGRFKDGLYHGLGTYRTSNGVVYHGHFDVQGLAGEGTIQYANGDVYEGEWDGWDLHGHGRFTADGTLYEGEFARGEPVGEFIIRYANGDQYKGGYHHWMFEGAGEYTRENGATYRGTFSDGELTGEATVIDAQGNHYVGAVSYWRFDGEGTLRYANGNVYVGEFSAGEFHGNGVLERDGTRYTGEFAYGEFSGQGRLETQGDIVSGRWRQGYYVGADAEKYVRDGLAQLDIESVLSAQPDLLQSMLAGIDAGTPQLTDVYSLVFASHAQQDVFKKEAELFRQIAPTYFANVRANLQLVNHRATVLDLPLANTNNLDRTLSAIGEQMNRDEDVLLLYITSHGSSKGRISVQMPDIRFSDLEGGQLKAMLDRAGIKWRVIIVSACYSGKLIADLADPASLVMTSARADRTSFGCGKDSDATFFGRALLQNSLAKSQSLEDAFFDSRKLVRARELEYGLTTYSEPQIHLGDEMRQKLAQSSLLQHRAEPKPELTAKLIHGFAKESISENPSQKEHQ
ncbi:MAG: C13 family peptidase [Pseudomonadota bacterium]